MKIYDVKKSWMKLGTVISQLQVEKFRLCVRPLACSTDGDEDLLELYSTYFVWYDLRRRKSRIVKIDGASELFKAGICVGSLVALNNGGGGVGGQVDWKKQPRDKRKTRKKRFGSILLVQASSFYANCWNHLHSFGVSVIEFNLYLSCFV